MSTSNACQHAEGKGTEGTPHCAWRKELYSPINALTREHCKMPSGTSDSILFYLEDNQRLTQYTAILGQNGGNDEGGE